MWSAALLKVWSLDLLCDCKIISGVFYTPFLKASSYQQRNHSARGPALLLLSTSKVFPICVQGGKNRYTIAQKTVHESVLPPRNAMASSFPYVCTQGQNVCPHDLHIPMCSQLSQCRKPTACVEAATKITRPRFGCTLKNAVRTANICECSYFLPPPEPPSQK